MKLNKRACRKYAEPKWNMDLNNGLFSADQLQYLVRTVIKNVDHQRVLILYVYDKKQVAAGETRPLWTMFQSRNEYITLARRENGDTCWRSAIFDNLDRGYSFRKKCAFYSISDEKRVVRFCKKEQEDGFTSLYTLQYSIMYQCMQRKRYKKQKVIVRKMKEVPSLPGGFKHWVHKEVMPAYIFYTYSKNRKWLSGYCTACGKEVKISGIKHNSGGSCPHCNKDVIYKSRGRRGSIIDRETVQIIQNISERELIVRFAKIYRKYPNSDIPDDDIYESARIFVTWDSNGDMKEEDFYCSFESGDMTPWKKGTRPVFSRWQNNFNADNCGYLYDKNLDSVLENTPWRYAQLKQFYQATYTPFYVMNYLNRFVEYPMMEYMVKLKLYKLAADIVDPRYYYNTLNQVINPKGNSINEVLGLDKSHLPLLQKVNPGSKQFELIKKCLKNRIKFDENLFHWCGRYGVGRLENLTVPLQYMTVHKLIRYASEQFEQFKRKSWSDPVGYYDMETLLNNYRDYLCMCEALEYDLSNSFVLYPANLPKAHDKVNDLSDTEQALAYEKQIQRLYQKLNSHYEFARSGYFIALPRSVKEIIEEGHKLHHCIGSYVKRIVKRQCLILFLRKVKEPDKPLCTVELNGVEIGQTSMFSNRPPTPPIKAFLKMWEREVLQAPALQEAA